MLVLSNVVYMLSRFTCFSTQSRLLHLPQTLHWSHTILKACSDDIGQTLSSQLLIEKDEHGLSRFACLYTVYLHADPPLQRSYKDPTTLSYVNQSCDIIIPRLYFNLNPSLSRITRLKAKLIIKQYVPIDRAS